MLPLCFFINLCNTSFNLYMFVSYLRLLFLSLRQRRLLSLSLSLDSNISHIWLKLCWVFSISMHLFLLLPRPPTLRPPSVAQTSFLYLPPIIPSHIFPPRSLCIFPLLLRITCNLTPSCFSDRRVECLFFSFGQSWKEEVLHQSSSLFVRRRKKNYFHTLLLCSLFLRIK